MYLLYYFGFCAYILLGCSSSAYISDLFPESENQRQLLFKSNLSNLSETNDFRMMSSVNCSSSGVTDLITTLKQNDSDTVFLYCFSGFFGSEKNNLERTQKIAEYIKSCIETELNQTTVKAVGFGSTMPYYMECDTIIGGVKFSEGELVTKEKVQSVDRKKAMYFELIMNRVEIYGKKL